MNTLRGWLLSEFWARTCAALAVVLIVASFGLTGLAYGVALVALFHVEYRIRTGYWLD